MTLQNNIKTLLKTEISFRKTRLKEQKKKDFFNNLSILLSAGINIKDSLDIMISDFSDNESTTKVLDIIRIQITKGKSFAYAIENSKSFSNYEIFNIRIGEETGKLPIIISNLADYLNRRLELRRKITSALSYPIIVFITAILAVLFMLNFVVPMFADIFDRFGKELPFLTQLIIKLSDNSIWIFLIISSIVITYYILNTIFKASDFYQRNKAKIILSIPIVGSIIRKIHLGRFASAMELFISASIPIHKAISLIIEMSNYYPIRSSLKNIENKIISGDSFYDAVNSQVFFDKRLVAMIKVGMETNNLEDIFRISKENYYEDISYNTTILNNVLEPILIVFIGFIVAIILIGMYLPIFKLSMSFNI